MPTFVKDGPALNISIRMTPFRYRTVSCWLSKEDKQYMSGGCEFLAEILWYNVKYRDGDVKENMF